jgi:hypothetical protein
VSDAVVDVVPDGGKMLCDPAKPFTSLKVLNELDNVYDQGSVTLSEDENDIWYGLRISAPDGGQNYYGIVHATRTSRSQPFGTPIDEPACGSGAADPSVTDDALSIYFVRWGTVGSVDLFLTSRPNRTAPFAGSIQLPGYLQSSKSEIAPLITSGRDLYFCSDRGGQFDVYRAANVDGGLAAPVVVSDLSSTADEYGVTLSRDGLWAYVTSARVDLGSAGDHDIFLAHRATVGDPFVGLTNQPELNSAVFDRANWLSADGCRLYMESTRGGDDDIYVAEKTP